MIDYILGDFFENKVESRKFDLIFTGIPDLQEIGVSDEIVSGRFIDRAIDEIARLIKNDGLICFTQTDRKKDGKIILKHFEIISKMTAKGFFVKDYKIVVKNSPDRINLFRLNFSHLLVFSRGGKIGNKQNDYLRDVYIFKWPQNGNYWPIEFTDLIVGSLSKENDYVLDPFAGRGTVLASCKKMNRNGIGYEIKPEMYNDGIRDFNLNV